MWVANHKVRWIIVLYIFIFCASIDTIYQKYNIIAISLDFDRSWRQDLTPTLTKLKTTQTHLKPILNFKNFIATIA